MASTVAPGEGGGLLENKQDVLEMFVLYNLIKYLKFWCYYVLMVLFP